MFCMSLIAQLSGILIIVLYYFWLTKMFWKVSELWISISPIYATIQNIQQMFNKISVFFFLGMFFFSINYGHFWRWFLIMTPVCLILWLTQAHRTMDSFPIEGKETKYVLYLKETPECPANLEISSTLLELLLQNYWNIKWKNDMINKGRHRIQK